MRCIAVVACRPTASGEIGRYVWFEACSWRGSNATVGGRCLGRTCVCVAPHWCCVMYGCGCATVRTHYPTDPVDAWLTCSLSYTHTRGHVRGVRECLVWAIAGKHADSRRWWRRKHANTKQGKQAGLRPHPPLRLINPLYCRQSGNRGGGSCPEALHSTQLPCFPANVISRSVSTVQLHIMGRETIQRLQALSDVI